MQKIALREIIREELIRAMVFAATFFVLITAWSIGIAYAAADGWLFGNLLNQILVSAWDDPANDGTVKNAASLGWVAATSYVKLSSDPALRSCATNKCIYWFEADGSVKCTP